MSKVYLAHHGIMKQRWGVKNGPPYPLANKDRSKAERRANKESESSKEKTVDAKYREVKSGPVDSVNKNDVQSAVNDADRAVRGINNLVPHKREDLSQYSDAELQKIVNRQQLEQRYYQLNPDTIEKGTAYTREALQTAGALAAVYLTYRKLKGK